jgi:outer membrane protein TolC
MRFEQRIWACFRIATAFTLAALLFASGFDVSASEQQAPPQTTPAQQATSPPLQSGNSLRITQDEAVRLALENNLGVQAQRLDPQIEDYSVAQALAVYAPELFGGFSRTANTSPPTEFLQAGVATTTSASLNSNGGVRQNLPWGGGYSVGLTGGRRTTDAPRSVFSPQLSSDFTLGFTQPLLRDFTMDSNRNRILQAKNREQVVDIQLQERLTQTSRAVRNAYLQLVRAISGLAVAEQSLELTKQALKNNQRRVEVGASAPIEIVASEAEVARNEEGVIARQGDIDAAQDQLRTLILNPAQPDFWTVRFEPAEQPVVTAQPIDVDAAIRNALTNRTDINQLRKQVESIDLSIRFNKNQKLPAVDLNARYGLTGVGGTQFQYGPSPIDGGIPEVLATSQRSFGDVLRDVFGNEFRNWSVSLDLSYPIGNNPAGIALAQNRLQRQQAQVSLKELETEIVRQVREAGRQVQNTLKRVEATIKARELAERQLEAEEKRLQVGLSDSFRLFQYQRDLNLQRQAELGAIIAYNSALIDFEAVQIIPVR